jgi:hypothetical protein
MLISPVAPRRAHAVRAEIKTLADDEVVTEVHRLAAGT